MGKKVYTSTTLSAKIVKSMIEIPGFKKIADIYEDIHLLKQECKKISSKPQSMQDAEDMQKLSLNEKLRKNKLIIRQYLEQAIEEAKSSNGNWHINQTLTEEQKSYEASTRKKLSSINEEFKAKLEHLEMLKRKDNLSLYDNSMIIALDIEISRETFLYQKSLSAGNTKKSEPMSVA